MTLAFDPGIGFGKTPAHNLSLLKNLARLRVGDQPLVVGVSRKSFLSKIPGTLLRGAGADVVRVHDVKENREALRVADALRNAA